MSTCVYTHVRECYKTEQLRLCASSIDTNQQTASVSQIDTSGKVQKTEHKTTSACTMLVGTLVATTLLQKCTTSYHLVTATHDSAHEGCDAAIPRHYKAFAALPVVSPQATHSNDTKRAYVCFVQCPICIGHRNRRGTALHRLLLAPAALVANQ